MTADMHAPSQIEERAKAIWKAMLDEAQNKGLHEENTEWGRGYCLTGNISEFARACWPGTNFKKGSGKTAMNMIRQFLRATGNVVSIEGGRRGRCFVRKTWAYRDSIPVVVSIGTAPSARQQAIAAHEAEQRRKEAKITPAEAGETMPPAPVDIRKGQVMSHPEHGKGEPDKVYPNIIRFANGMVQCTLPECMKVLKPQGMAPHVKMHDNEERDRLVDELREQLTTAREAAVANLATLDPAQALALVQTRIQNLESMVQQQKSVIEDDEQRLLAANAEIQRLTAVATSADDTAKVTLIREVLLRVQKSEITMMRALSDINDALEA